MVVAIKNDFESAGLDTTVFKLDPITAEVNNSQQQQLAADQGDAVGTALQAATVDTGDSEMPFEIFARITLQQLAKH
ncbi:hypothetical protein CYMTET_45358 [Cymbomonas tetramitiformis]|uniref:Uncharacterized protein n=1 Tax=Cymbomonas tetramitiformis TaxID=36881 RepID=A0AAE0BYE5_9CHLO|nr:hypothetical protein CYMTET_45358 [Cymbomonas tetramitiformis]